jgi:NAD(P)H dehydrogenase (quinone)
MHVLVVMCHPKEDSFTHAITDQVVKGAESKDHTVRVVDLYKDGFQPVFTPRDWEQFEGVPMTEDVLEQQRFVEDSDAIFLVFPIWWYQMPAMLKGYLDRVWSAGWCYKSERNPEGTLLKSRPCTVLALAGASSNQLNRWGYDKQIHHLWRYGIFGYCGFEPLRITILDDCSYPEMGKHPVHLQTAFEAGQKIGSDPEALPGIKPYLDKGLNIHGEKHIEG